MTHIEKTTNIAPHTCFSIEKMNSVVFSGKSEHYLFIMFQGQKAAEDAIVHQTVILTSIFSKQLP